MLRNHYWFAAVVITLLAAARDGFGALVAFALVFWLLSAFAPRRT